MPDLVFDTTSFSAAIDELVPEYQRTLVRQALELNSATEADFDGIGLLITGEKRQNKMMFYTGVPGERQPSVWEHVKAELYDFLCTSSKKYAQERNDGATTIKQVIAIVATAIASTINVAVGVIVGAVTVALISALKIGKNAWCEANKSRPVL
jgi:hypothetical protein